MSKSPAQRLLELPRRERKATLAAYGDDGLERLMRDWRFWARPEQIAPPGLWTLWAMVTGRGFGKLLDVDTPIPTPFGWSRLGDIRPGDEVFDESGRGCNVVAVHDDIPVRAWRVVFSDGAEVTAGGEHMWMTWTHHDRKAWNRSDRRTGGLPDDWPTWRSTGRWGQATGPGARVRSTDEIVGTLTYGNRRDRNHSIPTTAPLVGIPARLPIDPWLLGFWLGDGDTRNPALTIGAEDQAFVLGRLDRLGIRWTRWQTASDNRFGLIGQTPAFRSLGVLGWKHIPSSILRGSIGERVRLLRGLMDSDGYIDAATGHAEFTTTKAGLADDVLELVRTLGERPVRSKGTATLNGVEIGPKWRISWRPTRVQPFSIPRKRRRVRPLGAQSSRLFHRMIVDCVPVPIRPMRCLTVDSPNRLFLAGDAMIPTHNTRGGAEFVLDRSERFATYGARHRGLLVGKTAADCRDVMVEGESGLIECGERRGYRVKYEPSKRRVTIPELDTTCTTFTAEKPDQLRGHQGHTAWADEPAAWKHLVDREGNSTWSNLMLALRLEGAPPADWFDELDDEDDDLPEFQEAPPDLQPQACATTTPKPIPLVREWVERATNGDPSIRLTTGSMLENVANLAPRFVDEVISRYGGTRLGAQEIEGLLLDAVEGALWTPDLIERWRIHRRDMVPDLSRKVVAIDPSGSGPGRGDECGICVAGVEANPANPIRRHFYVLDDLSTPERPEVWGRIAVDAYHREQASCIVAETNFGAALVVDVIHLIDPSVPVETVVAHDKKIPRAQPVALLWDQGRGHLVGYFGLLEAQMTTWVPDLDDYSPDRMDAMVWAAHFLLPEISRPPASTFSPAAMQIPTGADAATRSDSMDPFGLGPQL